MTKAFPSKTAGKGRQEHCCTHLGVFLCHLLQVISRGLFQPEQFHGSGISRPSFPFTSLCMEPMEELILISHAPGALPRNND